MTTNAVGGRVFWDELHQSDPQKYSPSSPVPWKWWKQSFNEKCQILSVTFVEINSAWVGLSEQVSSTNWGPSYVICESLMKLIILSLVWFALLPCTSASCKTCRLERNTLEMLFSSKKYLSKWCLAQQKHCPRLCLSCFQLLQMVSSNIWGRLQS